MNFWHIIRQSHASPGSINIRWVFKIYMPSSLSIHFANGCYACAVSGFAAEIRVELANNAPSFGRHLDDDGWITLPPTSPRTIDGFALVGRGPNDKIREEPSSDWHSDFCMSKKGGPTLMCQPQLPEPFPAMAKSYSSLDHGRG